MDRVYTQPGCFVHADTQKNFACNDDMFKCTNGFCIEKKRQCNGVHDCSDRSDEQNCPARNNYIFFFISFP